MTNALLICIGILSAIQLTIIAILLFRRTQLPDVSLPLIGLEKGIDRVDRSVRDEIARNRDEASAATRQSREEQSSTLSTFGRAVTEQMAQIAGGQKAQLDTFSAQLGTLTQSNEQRLETLRQTLESKLGQLQADANTNSATSREELIKSSNLFCDQVLNRMSEVVTFQKNQFDTFATGLKTLTENNDRNHLSLRETLENRLNALQADNAQKLEAMRQTVDEKLHATLEHRLGESFKLVSERLEMVHKGLGEMQSLANGVGDLKKVLTNIKTRGNWGEVQLGNLLDQLFTPDQYATNVQVRPDSQERVEFAIKLPGRDNNGKNIWLPIDAKFPQETYQRLVDAAEKGQADDVASLGAVLEASICTEAKKIKEKYIHPPFTTDFALLFLPTEGLYAEVLRRPGLCDGLLRDYRVVLSGPTTLAAILSSLQMGFRTLAIEKRSSEVWQVLGAVKTEFGKFGEVLEKVQKKLQEASNTVDAAATRSRVLEKKLRGVEMLPEEQAAHLLDNASVIGISDASVDGVPVQPDGLRAGPTY